MAELVTAVGVRKVLEMLRRTNDLIIVDCSSSMTDTTLAILDQADVILTMLTLEITSIKNMRLFLEVTDQLGYESSSIKLVLNRADSTLGIRVARRRTVDRPQGRPYNRERRSQCGLRSEPRDPVFHEQPGGAGVAGHPATRNVIDQGRA